MTKYKGTQTEKNLELAFMKIFRVFTIFKLQFQLIDKIKLI